MRRSSRVADYMTPSAHFTDSEVSLYVARERMRRMGVRNLPVIQHGKLCGVLTERDLALAESLPDLDLTEVSVGAAMGRDLYPVACSTPLEHVVRTMAAHGYCCAVVMADGAVAGVFATSDALRVLSAMLEGQSDQNGMSASEVRGVILTEHAHVDALLLRTQRVAHRLRSRREPASNAGRVREQATQAGRGHGRQVLSSRHFRGSQRVRAGALRRGAHALRQGACACAQRTHLAWTRHVRV